jgi:hypothetical protein
VNFEWEWDKEGGKEGNEKIKAKSWLRVSAELAHYNEQIT